VYPGLASSGRYRERHRPQIGGTEHRLGVKPNSLVEEIQGELFNSSSSALASFRSAVSKPSVNQL
jgi:hypothetical protein